MLSKPDTLRFGGALAGAVAAVAITLVLLQSGRSHLSGDQSNSERYDTSSYRSADSTSNSASDNAPGQTSRSGTISTDSDAAVVAEVLHAARDSLDSNNLAAAKMLLDTVQSLHGNDPQVVALERELQAREAGALNAPPGAGSGAANVAKSSDTATRSASHASAKGEHSRSRAYAFHEHGSGTSRRAGNERVSAGDNNAPAFRELPPIIGQPGSTTAPVVVSPATQSAAPNSAAPSVVPESAPLAPPAVTPAAPPAVSPGVSPGVSPTAPPALSPADNSQLPKTRAQVRAEVVRARSNGALPRFGNPDPAGPGGALSYTIPQPLSH